MGFELLTDQEEVKCSTHWAMRSSPNFTHPIATPVCTGHTYVWMTIIIRV